ncbi:hypothetical protein JZ751_001208 [Albula glossodonta]|uniref:Uncharacterized protein n=1 Tax=Albula glossodonta TaxID=121402 RepID=A0A8T2PT88_9TELE|nr:hypothetical protein JZ751_001208 [Albula glossodonta]
MNRIKEKLRAAEQKRKVFRQQQGIFITALGRSQEQAQEKTKPVSSVAQVQWYLEDHCSNTTDRRVFSLFLEITEDLMEVLELLEIQGATGSLLDDCRILLCPTTDISGLRAVFPNDELNRLSCIEARSYYGVAMDLLRELARTTVTIQRDTTKSEPSQKSEPPSKSQPVEFIPQQATDIIVEDKPAIRNDSSQSQTRKPSKETMVFSAGKPAWKPPGRPRKMVNLGKQVTFSSCVQGKLSREHGMAAQNEIYRTADQGSITR